MTDIPLWAHAKIFQPSLGSKSLSCTSPLLGWDARRGRAAYQLSCIHKRRNQRRRPARQGGSRGCVEIGPMNLEFWHPDALPIGGRSPKIDQQLERVGCCKPSCRHKRPPRTNRLLTMADSATYSSGKNTFNREYPALKGLASCPPRRSTRHRHRVRRRHAIRAPELSAPPRSGRNSLRRSARASPPRPPRQPPAAAAAPPGPGWWPVLAMSSSSTTALPCGHGWQVDGDAAVAMALLVHTA